MNRCVLTCTHHSMELMSDGDVKPLNEAAKCELHQLTDEASTHREAQHHCGVSSSNRVSGTHLLTTSLPSPPSLPPCLAPPPPSSPPVPGSVTIGDIFPSSKDFFETAFSKIIAAFEPYKLNVTIDEVRGWCKLRWLACRTVQPLNRFPLSTPARLSRSPLSPGHIVRSLLMSSPLPVHWLSSLVALSSCPSITPPSLHGPLDLCVMQPVKAPRYGRDVCVLPLSPPSPCP